ISDDAYLIVYEIDSEGYVRLLFPSTGSNGWVEGHTHMVLPPRDADYTLVTQGPEGVSYVVAIASRQPFYQLPWYLRPYDTKLEPGEFQGQPNNDEEGVTKEGQIVGDPFVAMERIRRRVCGDSLAPSDFSSAYATYYVGHEFKYPRYLCYDCHRPHYWAWWDGFDPYYSTCSVFAVRVNFGWWWGYPCWTGFVPYYYYAVVPGCPPYYRPYVGTVYSSWDGWNRWTSLWGDHIIRYKPAPAPVGYIPPIRASDGRYVSRPQAPAPPGFRNPSGGGTVRPLVRDPRIGRPSPADAPDREPRDPSTSRLVADRSPMTRPTVGRFPARQWPDGQPRPIYGAPRGSYERPLRPQTVEPRPDVGRGRYDEGRGRVQRETPPAHDPPPARQESPPRMERSAPPRQDGGGHSGWGRQGGAGGGNGGRGQGGSGGNGGRGQGGGGRGRER